MKHSLLTSIPPEVKTPVISLLGAVMLIGTVGFTQQVSALDVGPGETAYFNLPEDSFGSNSPDCDLPANLCEPSSSFNAGSSQAGSYAISIFTQTNTARQSSGLIKKFSVPDSPLGEPENTVLDARITGSTKWRGSLWSIDFSTFGPVIFPSLGPKAEAFIRVSLVDVTNPSEPFEAGNTAIADFDCTPDRALGATIPLPLVSEGVELAAEVGWCEEDSEDTFNFGAKVIQGHDYELQLIMICQAITGVKPTLLSACTFNPSPVAFDLTSLVSGAFDDLINNSDLSIDTPAINIVLPNINIPIEIPLPDPAPDLDFDIDVDVPDISIPGATIDFAVPLQQAVQPTIDTILNALVPKIDDGYLQWDYMTVTIDPDVTALIGSTKNEILGQVGLVRDDLEVVRKGVGQSINLLHTPQGKRETTTLDGYPDLCGDGNCDWGETP